MRKRFIAGLIVAELLLCGAGAWSDSAQTIRQPETVPPDKVLTLADCIGLALRNQSTVRQAIAQISSENGSVMQARSNLLPDLQVGASTDIARSGPRTGPQLTGTLNQLIFDLGRSRSGLNQAQQQREASISGLVASRFDVVNNVKQSYYGLLRNVRLVRVFEENVKAQDEHVKLAQARLDVGFAPKADALKAEADSASARVDLVTAGNAAAQARVDLNAAMGVDLRSTTQISETAEADTPVPDVDTAVNAGIKNRPEMRQSQSLVAAAQSAINVAVTGNLPSISTSLSDSQRSQSQFTQGSSWQWMVNLQWTPFDSGFTKGRITQARANLVSAQESLYQTRQTVSSEVVAARLNLIATQESLAAAEVAVASAQQNLNAATGRYQGGVGIFLEVTDAQALLLKAQVNEAIARYGMSIARAALEHATGVTVIEGAAK